MTTVQQAITPVHQWTNAAGRVLILKCVAADGTSFENFKWPESGAVKPAKCKPDDDCNTGGLFGWPNGIGFGDGKAPDYAGRWIVFSAPPSQVYQCGTGGKVKVAAATPDEVDAVVEFYGDWWGAMDYIGPSMRAWIQHAARGAASSTGDRGAASSTGYSGAASSTGDRGAACITGEYSTIEVGPHSLGAATPEEFYWRVRPGAVVAFRWTEFDDDGKPTMSHHGILVAEELKLTDGQLVLVRRGAIVA